jgi:hypothetical protein
MPNYPPRSHVQPPTANVDASPVRCVECSRTESVGGKVGDGAGYLGGHEVPRIRVPGRVTHRARRARLAGRRHGARRIYSRGAARRRAGDATNEEERDGGVVAWRHHGEEAIDETPTAGYDGTG